MTTYSIRCRNSRCRHRRVSKTHPDDYKIVPKCAACGERRGNIVGQDESGEDSIAGHKRMCTMFEAHGKQLDDDDEAGKLLAEGDPALQDDTDYTPNDNSTWAPRS
jgi:hypothetical protein